MFDKNGKKYRKLPSFCRYFCKKVTYTLDFSTFHKIYSSRKMERKDDRYL